MTSQNHFKNTEAMHVFNRCGSIIKMKVPFITDINQWQHILAIIDFIATIANPCVYWSQIEVSLNLKIFRQLSNMQITRLMGKYVFVLTRNSLIKAINQSIEKTRCTFECTYTDWLTFQFSCSTSYMTDDDWGTQPWSNQYHQ